MLDATTGQNGIVQARVFTEAVDVTGVVLTKLDGTAKGGIVVSVQRELGIPVKLIGLGEGATTWRPSSRGRSPRRWWGDFFFWPTAPRALSEGVRPRGPPRRASRHAQVATGTRRSIRMWTAAVAELAAQTSQEETTLTSPSAST